jgi:hypothetical protein
MYTPHPRVLQVEAIRSAMQPGLTLVVGPPGTGKTDLAVQVIANLYHNHPHERTIVVAHSNTALNQLFEKIMALDIDERHLLRLGRGEEQLDTDKDFSKFVNFFFVFLLVLPFADQLAEGMGAWTLCWPIARGFCSRWSTLPRRCLVRFSSRVNVLVCVGALSTNRDDNHTTCLRY